AGARWLVLCDTNGGTLPARIAEVVDKLIAGNADAHAFPGTHLGIHTHNDTEQAVAGSLAAVDAGACQIQGTLNGLGERCGNANLTALIPTLLLKEPYASRFETGVTPEALEGLTRASRQLDEILNRVPQKQAAYVGASAFAHKAGLHASAIVKNPATYEHIDPAQVGNARIIPMSNQAGQSNLRRRLTEAGVEVEKDNPALLRILQVVKDREDRGYTYDMAQASFELLARDELGLRGQFFEVERYRVISERRRNARGQVVVESEAVVTVQLQDGSKRTGYYKNEHATDLHDDGPVNALWQALRTDLGPYQAAIDGIRLTDFKVRITNGGTEAVTRVIIDFEDETGRTWSTVGVSPNIVDASFEALLDAINWRLLRNGSLA
ncbi:MAG: alpha-isopropylmalate synthase regulatory domain-containing protein, partial [Pseudomonadota bacterium]